jgi:pectinesterase
MLLNYHQHPRRRRKRTYVIEKSLNLTTEAIEHNYFTVKKLIKTRKNLTNREKTALHDFLETIGETLDELHEAMEDLPLYPNKKSLSLHANDLKTLISSAVANQETCLDGFSPRGWPKPPPRWWLSHPMGPKR